MMSASKWIISLCLVTCFLKCSASEEEKTVKSGENVTLQCQGRRDAEIDTVMFRWIRPDLSKSEGYVFYFKHNQTQDLQHEYFKNRVELMDPEMKHGNFSVILKNVTINDNGTYECYVGYGGSTELINTINLTVIDSGGDEDEGDKDVNVGLAVGLSVGGVILVVLAVPVVCFVVIYIKRRRLRENNSNQRQRERTEREAEEETELQQLRNDTLNPESSGPAADT